MNRKFLIAGSIFGMLGVIIGAFATHGLKPLLSAEEISSFETGVRYQMYHAFLLLILGLKSPFNQKKNGKTGLRTISISSRNYGWYIIKKILERQAYLTKIQ